MKSAAIRKDEPPCQTDGSEDVNMSDQLEVRVARIESDVQHINEVTTDLRVELRRTNDKIDAGFQRLDKKVDDGHKELNKKIDDVYKELKDKLYSLSLWALLLYITLAGGLLTVIARAFKWM